jgi:hypothetical protein
MKHAPPTRPRSVKLSTDRGGAMLVPVWLCVAKWHLMCEVVVLDALSFAEMIEKASAAGFEPAPEIRIDFESIALTTRPR